VHDRVYHDLFFLTVGEPVNRGIKVVEGWILDSEKNIPLVGSIFGN